jgi:hypothetical protein
MMRRRRSLVFALHFIVRAVLMYLAIAPTTFTTVTNATATHTCVSRGYCMGPAHFSNCYYIL